MNITCSSGALLWPPVFPVEVDRITTRRAVSVNLFLAKFTGTYPGISCDVIESIFLLFCPHPRTKSVSSESAGVGIVASKPEVYMTGKMPQMQR